MALCLECSRTICMYMYMPAWGRSWNVSVCDYTTNDHYVITLTVSFYQDELRSYVAIMYTVWWLYYYGSTRQGGKLTKSMDTTAAPGNNGNMGYTTLNHSQTTNEAAGPLLLFGLQRLHRNGSH